MYTDGAHSLRLTSDNGYFIPFIFYGFDEPYRLNSIQLLLSGDADLSDISLLATSTLGIDLTLPPILTTFSTTGTLTDTPTVYTFGADSFPHLTPGSTYYVRLLYTGTDTANWVLTSVAASGGEGSSSGGDPSTSGGYGSPPPVHLSPMVGPIGHDLSFMTRWVTSTSYSNQRYTAGISITATAVPEPAHFALGVTGFTLTMALLVRLRRRR